MRVQLIESFDKDQRRLLLTNFVGLLIAIALGIYYGVTFSEVRDVFSNQTCCTDGFDENTTRCRDGHGKLIGMDDKLFMFQSSIFFFFFFVGIFPLWTNAPEVHTACSLLVLFCVVLCMTSVLLILPTGFDADCVNPSTQPMTLVWREFIFDALLIYILGGVFSIATVAFAGFLLAMVFTFMVTHVCGPWKKMAQSVDCKHKEQEPQKEMAIETAV